jgi:putative ABC transport system permease protein
MVERAEAEQRVARSRCEVARMRVTPRDPFPLIEAMLLTLLPEGARGRSMAGDLREEWLVRRNASVGRAWVLYMCGAANLVMRYGAGSVWQRLRKRGSGSMWEEFRQDLRFGFRALIRRPAFAAIAVLTLGLGIGANTAIFTVVHGVMLRPLPYADPDRLVMIWNRVASGSLQRVPVAAPDFAEYTTETTAFSAFAALFAGTATLVEGEEPEQVSVGNTTANLFRLLGVSPVLGRDFREEDGAPLPPAAFADAQNLPPGVALLSHEYWRTRFGADPAVIGQTVTLNGRGTTLVGVLPADFSILLPADASVPPDLQLWTPLQQDFTQGSRRAVFLRVLARLRADATLEQGQAELAALGARFRELHQPHRVAGVHIEVAPLQDEIVAPLRSTLIALLTAVGLLLLVACANVASLLMAHATTRRRELAVRLAIGAGRRRLVRQLLTESLILGTAAGLVGLGLGAVAVEAILGLAPSALPRASEMAVSPAVIGFTLAVSTFSALLFGTAPALPRSLPAVGEALRVRSADAGTRPGRNRLRSGLVVAQVAISIVLIFSTGLVLRTFVHLADVRPGFESDARLTFRVALPFTQYNTPEAQYVFFSELQRRLSEVPGVETVGALRTLPFQSTPPAIWQSYRIDDEAEDGAAGHEANVQPVLPGAFESLGVRLLEGRLLTEDDIRSGRNVVVIDENLARRWAGESALGRFVRLRLPGAQGVGDQTPMVPLEVVGVIGSVQIEQLGRDARPAMYLPHPLYPGGQMGVVVHARRQDAALIPAIHAAVRATDPALPVVALRPLADYVRDARAPLSFMLTLAMIFGSLALSIAMLGLFGVVSYIVRLRSREIAVRIALGATRRRILGEVMRGGMLLVGAGLGLGLLASVWLTRGVESLLIGVPRHDPLTAAGTAGLVAIVGLIACLLPARRAAAIEPGRALGAE